MQPIILMENSNPYRLPVVYGKLVTETNICHHFQSVLNCWARLLAHDHQVPMRASRSDPTVIGWCSTAASYARVS